MQAKFRARDMVYLLNTIFGLYDVYVELYIAYKKYNKSFNVERKIRIDKPLQYHRIGFPVFNLLVNDFTYRKTQKNLIKSESVHYT